MGLSNPDVPAQTTPRGESRALRELAALFLKLGFTAFGGRAAGYVSFGR